MSLSRVYKTKKHGFTQVVRGTNEALVSNSENSEFLWDYLGYSALTINTQTLTDVNVKIWGQIENGGWFDLTTELCGVAVLAQNTTYIIDINISLDQLKIEHTPTNAVNVINYEFCIRKSMALRR
jgi:hypothetical protein